MRQEGEALGVLVKRGLRWSLAGNVSGRAVTLVTGIVLAHLLAPRDYGEFSVALVALVLIASINDLGLEQSIVRWEGDLDEIAPTATTIVFLFSCALFAGLFAAAPYLAATLNAPSATGIVRLLSIGVVINGAFTLPSAQLTRGFEQGRRTIADFTGFAVTTALTILLAAHGYGAWSLAWGRLVGNAVNSLMYFAFAPARYRPGWSPDAARRLLRNGLPLAGTSLLAVASLNIDYAVVGHVLGPVSLGLYLLAFNLSSWPVNVFAVAVAKVSLAGFARLQHDLSTLRPVFVRSFGLLMGVTIPVCVLLATLGLPLVRLVYGRRWAPAASAMAFLAALAGLRVALHLASDVLVAVGRARTTLAVQALWFLALLPALTIGAHIGGIRGAAIGHVVVAGLVVLPAFAVALGRLGIRPAMLAASLVRPIAGGAAAALAAGLMLRMVDSDFVGIALGGSLGIVAYAIVVGPMYRHFPALGPDVELSLGDAAS